MDKTFNIYCDESCHLENDHKNYMFLGSVSCAYPQVKRHTERIKELKNKHKFNAEIKWGNVSMSKIDFYLDLVDYFFDTDLWFRAVGIDNASIEELAFNTAQGRDKNQILSLATCEYIKQGASVLVTGPAGVGKSFIASALGYQV